MLIPRDAIFISYELNRYWIKIFYHNVINQEYFSKDDESEIQFINDKNRFSILGYINDEFKIDNYYYEFLLKYPEYPGYNHWQQTISPLSIDETESNGYKVCNDCKLSWTGYSWKGLSRSSRTSETYIDGSIGSHFWWYSIGAMHQHSNKKFPGPVSGGREMTVSEVYLYLRVSYKILMKLFPHSKKEEKIKGFLKLLFVSIYKK